jgi:MoaA/NifB/PqqE/SkfB family radical SAM enzyme
MHERKKEMRDFISQFEDMPDRLLKYCEILLEVENASPYCYQDTMSYRRLAIELTTYCNLNCKWCYRHDPNYKFILNKKLPVEKLEKIVKNTEGRFRMVHPGGLGEPLLYPHLSEAINLTKNLSDKIKITTNGTLLTKELITEMVQSGLTHIEVSIDAFTEEKNREFRGSRLRDLVEKLVYISENTDLHLQINSVVANINIDSLENLVDALKDAKNINIIHTIPLFETEQCRREGIKRVSDKVYKNLLTGIRKGIEKYNLDWKMFPTPEGVALDPVMEMKRKKNICFTCFEDPYISVNGELLPCGRQKIYGGVDATVGFEKAWNHPKLLEFREKMLKGDYPELCGKLCFLKEKI